MTTTVATRQTYELIKANQKPCEYAYKSIIKVVHYNHMHYSTDFYAVAESDLVEMMLSNTGGEPEQPIWEDELIEVVPYDLRHDKSLVYVAAKKDLVAVSKDGYVPSLSWAIANNRRHAYYSVAIMKNKMLNKIDKKTGATPLHLVAKGQSKGLFEYVLLRVDTYSILKRTKSDWDGPYIGDTALHLIVRYDCIALFRSLVKIRPDLMRVLANMVGNSGSVPLHLAVIRDSQEMIDYLLGHTKPSSIIRSRNDSSTILDSALLKGNDDVVRVLLSDEYIGKEIVKDSPRLLHTVAKSSYRTFKPIYSAFLAAGHSLIKTALHGTTFFTLMIHLLNSNCVVELIQDPDFDAQLLTYPDLYGNTPLHWAANGGLHEVCKQLYPTYEKAGLLLARNSEGRTALALAARGNTWRGPKVSHINYVATIESLTHDPIVGRKLVSMDDNNGYSPLYLAMTHDINNYYVDIGVCEALYDRMTPKQICRRYTSYEYSILYLACWHKKTDLIDVVMKDREKSRGLASIRDADGKTALQLAKKGSPEVHEHLIKVQASFQQ